jgi:hypothetical protein
MDGFFRTTYPFLQNIYYPVCYLKALWYTPEGRGFESRWGGFLNWPNPSSRAMAPGVDSASNRNDYQEFSCGVKGGA